MQQSAQSNAKRSRTDNPSAADSAHPQLFRHALREQWGPAIIAWDRPTKRAYQFDDGRLRVIKRGYYGLMRPVQLPADRARRLADRLRRQAGISRARRQIKRQARTRGKRVLTLDRQIEAFRLLFPKGFSGDEWRYIHRGVDAPRALKRHRDIHIDAARDSFDREQLRALVETEDFDGVIDRWVELLGRVDLVRKKEVEALHRLAPEERQRAARALVALLDAADDAERMRQLDALSRAAPSISWGCATAVLALLYPEQHICVRPPSFKKQARWMAPDLEHTKRVSSALYGAYREMVGRVAQRLRDAGLEPTDLFDVCDFIRISALPSTLEQLDKAEAASKAERVAAAADAGAAADAAPAAAVTAAAG